MFRTIERGLACIQMVTGMPNCWSVLVIAFNISSGEFKMRSWWTAAPDADYSKTLPQYNRRKYFQFPFILWRIQLGNSLWPRSFLSQPVGVVCLSEGGSVRWARGGLHTLLHCLQTLQLLDCVSCGERGGWWVDQPASCCPAGFSKKHLEGQRWYAITVIMIINV